MPALSGSIPRTAEAVMRSSDWPQLDGIPADVLVMFTIYDHPLDYPGDWVVRRCFCVPRAAEVMAGIRNSDELSPVFDVVPRLASSLDEARSFVPPGLYRQPRFDGDDGFIVETWF